MFLELLAYLAYYDVSNHIYNRYGIRTKTKMHKYYVHIIFQPLESLFDLIRNKTAQQ